MPYEATAVQFLTDQILARFTKAAKEESFREASIVAKAMEALKAWDEQGRRGGLPPEVLALEGLVLPQETAAAAPALAAAGAGAAPLSAPPLSPLPADPAAANPAPSQPAPDGKLAPGFEATLRAARLDVEGGRFDQAQAQLQALRDMVGNEAERSALAQAERYWREQRVTALEQALQTARATRRRGDWEAVLRIDPTLPEAVEGLRVLERGDLAKDALDELNKIQQRLDTIGVDLRAVNEALRKVEGLRYNKALIDAGRQAEVEMLLEQLKGLRAAIQKASDGGTSSERSGQLEKAYEIYRHAMRSGLEVIGDDVTGEPVDVREAYTRVRTKFFQLQVSRTEERYNEAVRALNEGFPEVAVSRLSEALELLGKVEDNSGADWRGRVEQLLDRARQEQAGKQQADKWVEDARTAPDARQELALLKRAQEAYARHPSAARLIGEVEERLVRIVLNELHVQIESAEAYLRGRKYEQARSVCLQALHIGEDYGFVMQQETYHAQRARLSDLLNRIGAAEEHWQILQTQIDGVKEALAAKDVWLAQQRLAEIEEADRGDVRVKELSKVLMMYSSDADLESDAAKAFEGQRYDQVIELCEQLQKKGGPYAESAGKLLRRARARLWSQQAAAKQEAGQLVEAEELYKQVAALRGMLPAEDAGYIEQAQAAQRTVVQERREGERLEKELKDLGDQRVHNNWEKWWQGLRALQQRAPEWFAPHIGRELGSGMDDWRRFAHQQVDKLYRGEESDWEAIYSVLRPFHRAGGIVLAARRSEQAGQEDDADLFEDELSALYRQAQLRYAQQQAQQLERSEDPRDLKRAYELRSDVYNLAPPPALAERRQMIDTLRLWMQRRAQEAAVSGGPARAVQVLLEQVETYGYELKNDPQLHQWIIYYALLARNFEVAAREANALQFLYPAERREGVRGWQQLVAAAAHFADAGDLANREQGVRELVLLRDALAAAPQVNGSSEDTHFLHQVADELANLLAESLHSEVAGALRRLSNDDILHRVRIYDLILQLRSDDKRAREGVVQLADRLNQIGQEWTDKARAQLSKGVSGEEGELKQLEVLNDELRAILQAYTMLNQMSAPTAFQLANLHEQVRQQLQQQRELKRLLDELGREWTRCLQATWDVRPVRVLLQNIQSLGRQGRGFDTADWESRAARAEETLARLKEELKQISIGWDSDEFEAVLQQIDHFGDDMVRARRELARELVLPPDFFAATDKYTRKSLVRLEDVQQAARSKLQNINAWSAWNSGFQSCIAEARSAQTAADKHLEAHPPCLSEGRKALETLLQRYRTLLRHLETMPAEVLSAKAERLTAPVRGRDLKTQAEQELADGEARLAAIDERMQQVQEPLLKLLRWRQNRPDLTRDANRRSLQQLVEAVRQIDACHPEIKRQEEQYQQIAKRPLFDGRRNA